MFISMQEKIVVGVQPIGVMRPKSLERSPPALESPRSPRIVNNAFMVGTQKVTLQKEDVEKVQEGTAKLEVQEVVTITCTDPAAIRDTFTSIPNSFGYSRVREVELVNHSSLRNGEVC
jgi:TusA-related sulfurtransferase